MLPSCLSSCFGLASSSPPRKNDKKPDFGKCTTFDEETGILVDKTLTFDKCYCHCTVDANTIGKGSNGVVTLTEPKYDVKGTSYPKELVVKIPTDDHVGALTNDAQISAKLHQLHYPFFTQYLGTFGLEEDGKKRMVMERISPIWEDLFKKMGSERKRTFFESLQKKETENEGFHWDVGKNYSGLDGIYKSRLLDIPGFPLTDPHESVFLKMVLYQVLESVDTMHQNNLLHLDIKTDNILLRKKFSSEGSAFEAQIDKLDEPPNFDAVLIDFGASYELGGSNWQSSWDGGQRGTFDYKAGGDMGGGMPGIDKRTFDSFALAITICDVFKGKDDVRPIIGHNRKDGRGAPDFESMVMNDGEEQRKKIGEIRQNLRGYTKGFPPGLGDLVEKMILQDEKILKEILEKWGSSINASSDKAVPLPAHRLLPEDALKHEYFKIGPYPVGFLCPVLSSRVHGFREVCPTGKAREQNKDWDCVCHSSPNPDSSPDFWEHQTLARSDANPNEGSATSGHYYLVKFGDPYPADCLWGDVGGYIFVLDGGLIFFVIKRIYLYLRELCNRKEEREAHSKEFNDKGGGPAFRDYQKFYIDQLQQKRQSEPQAKAVKAASFMQISQDFLEAGDTHHFLAPRNTPRDITLTSNNLSVKSVGSFNLSQGSGVDLIGFVGLIGLSLVVLIMVTIWKRLFCTRSTRYAGEQYKRGYLEGENEKGLGEDDMGSKEEDNVGKEEEDIGLLIGRV